MGFGMELTRTPRHPEHFAEREHLTGEREPYPAKAINKDDAGSVSTETYAFSLRYWWPWLKRLPARDYICVGDFFHQLYEVDPKRPHRLRTLFFRRSNAVLLGFANEDDSALVYVLHLRRWVVLVLMLLAAAMLYLVAA